MHRTHLYNVHVEAGARMVDFAGWEMPLHYGSQMDEHKAVRGDATDVLYHQALAKLHLGESFFASSIDAMRIHGGYGYIDEYKVQRLYRDAKILYGPAKAANAGGVAVSGLEMAQNSMRMSWSRKELNTHLGDIMRNIHERCVEFGTESDGYVDYLKGANIGGFKKVADALIAYGAC